MTHRCVHSLIPIMFSKNKTVMPFPTISRDAPFVLGAIAKSKRGQTYATINSDQNSVFQLTSFDSPLLVPFAAGVFQEKGDETRINLDAVVDGELLQVFDALAMSFVDLVGTLQAH